MTNLEKVLKYVSFGKREFLLEGPAGTGKTYLTKLVAEHLGAQYLFVQAYPGMKFEELTMQLLPSEVTLSGVEIVKGALVRAVEQSHNGPVVLVVDEFDKTIVSADSYLLDFLQNGRVTFKDQLLVANRDNLVVFLTSNGVREFSEPLLRRVVRIKFDHPTAARVVEMLVENGVPEDVAKVLAKIHQLTVKAQLRKPATIQELKEFWMAVEAGIELKDAVKEVLVKYEEDEEIVPEIVKLWLAAAKEETITEEQTTQEETTKEETTEEQTTEEQTTEEEETREEEITQEETTEEEITEEETIENYDQAIRDYVNYKEFEKVNVRLGKEVEAKYAAVFKPKVDQVVDFVDFVNSEYKPTDDPNVKVTESGQQVTLLRSEDGIVAATNNPQIAAQILERFHNADFYLVFETEVTDSSILTAEINHLVEKVKMKRIVQTTDEQIAVFKVGWEKETFVARFSKIRNKMKLEVVKKKINGYYYSSEIEELARFLKKWF